MPVFIRRLLLLACMSFSAAAMAAAPLVVDGDGDAVSDEIDDCPYTHPGVRVDAKGCPRKRDDGDLDGVTDEDDDCPYTTPGAVIDIHGCARDSDFDGVANGLDRCPRTALSRLVDAQGCATGERAEALAAPIAAITQPLHEAVVPAGKPAKDVIKSSASAAESPRLVVQFRDGSTRLGALDQLTIVSYARVFARRLAADPLLRLTLKGNADSAEPQAAALAVARLVAVRRLLVEQGIPLDRIRSESSVIEKAGSHAFSQVAAEIAAP